VAAKIQINHIISTNNVIYSSFLSKSVCTCPIIPAAFSYVCTDVTTFAFQGKSNVDGGTKITVNLVFADNRINTDTHSFRL
jgi:hypothetical protein